jgi:hypothetical protein
MSFFAPQNPGPGGLDELTNAEELFLTSLAGLSYVEGDVLTIVSGNPAWQAPGGAPGSGITRTVVVTSGNVTLGATAGVDYAYLVAGAHILTMPTAVGNTNQYTIKNNHSADITVNTTSSQTIDGSTSIQIAPEDSVDIVSNGTNWNII